MIAIVESGSTKSDWRIVDRKGTSIKEITAGFNPYFTDIQTVVAELSASAILTGLSSQIEAVHFYGAGCSSEEMNEVIAKALRVVFPTANVSVDHDLMGAALAAGQGRECIVCILGTGSNACYFDGKDIDNGRASLGYVLGDEAGGAWFGKRLVSDHLHGLLPAEMHQAMDELGITKQAVLQRVYREPRPNTYLAGFMPLLNRFRTEAYTQALLHEGMTAFLTRYVCNFPRHREVPVHFVGSVAFFFNEELKAAAQQLNLQVGTMVQHPINGLVEYHLTLDYN